MNKDTLSLERRRALRIIPSDLEASVTIGKHLYEGVSLIDLSTLGIGIALDALPEDPIGKFKFQNPEILRGLVLKAQKRFEKEQKRPDGTSYYRIGYEFLFSSAEEQNQLLRWFSNEMRLKIQAEAPGAEKNSHKKESPDFSLEVRFPQNEAEYEKCLELVRPLTVNHAMMQTKFFTVFERGQVLAVLPLFQNVSPFRMAAETLFPREMEALKSMRGHLGEIGLLYLNRDLPCLEDANLAPWYRLKILMGLFQHLFFYAKYFARLSHLVAVIPPFLEEFYRLWLFQERASVKRNFFQKNEEGKTQDKLVCIDLDTFEKRAVSERPEIISSMLLEEKRKDFLECLSASYYPTTPVMKKWFCDEYRIFETLRPEEANYFRFCFPEFFCTP